MCCLNSLCFFLCWTRLDLRPLKNMHSRSSPTPRRSLSDQVRARLADFAAQAATLTQPSTAHRKPKPVDEDTSGGGGGDGNSSGGDPGDESSANRPPSGTEEHSQDYDVSDAGEGGDQDVGHQDDGRQDAGADDDGAVDDGGVVEGCATADLPGANAMDAANGRIAAVVAGDPEVSAEQEAGSDAVEDGDDKAAACGVDDDVEASPTLDAVESSVGGGDLDDPTGTDKTESGAIQAQEDPASRDGCSAIGANEVDGDSVEEILAEKGGGADVVDV